MAMDAGQSRVASVQAGAAAGLIGFVTFLLLHHVWIAPIWSIAPIGVLVAAAGGAAVGAAYEELRPHLPRRPWTAIAVIVLVGAVLLPALVIAELRAPIFAMDEDGGGTFLVPGAEAMAIVVVELLGTATITGAGLGWFIARTRRATGATALAAFAFAIGPGHNIPLLGGTPAVAKELVILAGVVAVASVVLVEGHARLARLRPALDQRVVGSS
ncbi:MAG TPA: hypothetical protein VLS28_02195 [Candidatus Sulfomarinibacteraceae bacterium]|nr:hypothetical protein [Candidatus Sulfomarinibacteraceae bacterium]